MPSKCRPERISYAVHRDTDSVSVGLGVWETLCLCVSSNGNCRAHREGLMKYGYTNFSTSFTFPSFSSLYQEYTAGEDTSNTTQLKSPTSLAKCSKKGIVSLKSRKCQIPDSYTLSFSSNQCYKFPYSSVIEVLVFICMGWKMVSSWKILSVDFSDLKNCQGFFC